MVNEQALPQQADFELATYGEVLYAFSTLRSTSPRRRSTSHGRNPARGRDDLQDADECDVPPVPIKAPPTLHTGQLRPERLAKPRRAAGRCHCGQCRTCRENARWERIFQEKFANADYDHHEIRVRYASPLSSV